MKPTPTCKVCTSTASRLRGSKVGSNAVSFDYFTCEECRFMWVHPFPGYHVYDEKYYNGQGHDPYVNYAVEYANYASTDRVLEFADILENVRRSLGPASADNLEPRRWLDFGCGAGGFLKYLRDRQSEGTLSGFELHGSDVGRFADILRSVDGFPIHSEEALRDMPGVFDVITCVEVIEHVDDVNGTVALLARLLRPGGILILTTGNLRSPAARMAGLNYRYLIPEIHVSLFSPGVLERLYRKHGLVPTRLRYSGAVKFKILKSLRNPTLRAIARRVIGFPPVRRAVDAFYGVSAMPSAWKPLAKSEAGPSTHA